MGIYWRDSVTATGETRKRKSMCGCSKITMAASQGVHRTVVLAVRPAGSMTLENSLNSPPIVARDMPGPTLFGPIQRLCWPSWSVTLTHIQTMNFWFL